jgi:DNA polymerase III delta prime subunit
VEKYRPRNIKDCVLPQNLKDQFSTFVVDGIPNLLLTGGPGVGKTTSARAMLEEGGFDYMMINGSMNAGIDTLRTDIKNYASSVSLIGTRKYVILDEADYLNSNTTQPALRNFMEEFSKNCGFILTCNFQNKILPALQSRCATVDFKISGADKPKLAMKFLERLEYILEAEKVDFEKKVLADLIMKHFPDWRKVLNEIQRYSALGKIDTGILSKGDDNELKALVQILKKKNFNDMRKWVADNIDNDCATIFRKLYNKANTILKEPSVPQLVLIIADYQYKDAFVADHEVNLVACLTEIMTNCEFK